MTLDFSEERFRDCPNEKNAMAYAKAAKQYSEDGMIGANTVGAIAAELERAGFKKAMLYLMF